MLDQYYQRREIWRQKPQIRLVYERYAKKIEPFLHGLNVKYELGSGSGLLKELMPEVLLTDVVDLPWIDRRLDCVNMDLADQSVDGFIGIDVLHHVPDPAVFLREAARVLRPGGRLVMIDPYITAASYLPYKLLHHEVVYFKGYHPGGSGKDPWDGNLAMANLVFGRGSSFRCLPEELTIIHREKFSFFDFACAGGFKRYALVPHPIFRFLMRADDWLAPAMSLLAFRLFVVLEKENAS